MRGEAAGRMAIAPCVRAALAAGTVLVAVAGSASPAAGLPGRASTAALQVALRAEGVYAGDVDGLRGPATAAAVRTFQRRAGVGVDGVVGPRTRRALGRRGGPPLGARPLRRGASGWDVSGLQWLLARAGFPSGSIDGGFGARTDRALRRFQARAGLVADGIAGPATARALRRPSPQSPIALAWPVRAAIGDRFRFRGTRLHAGLDFTAPAGATVRAARSGVVASLGYDPFGWGAFVVLAHDLGVRTLYAHLSSVAVRRGRWVATGTPIGAVGSSGASTGPHLHFEVTSRGANVDPLAALR
jgi:murein DD-endopeptidase MepM/ murein hydrolase activator NlpD